MSAEIELWRSLSQQKRADSISKAARHYVQEAYKINPEVFCSQARAFDKVFKKEEWHEYDKYPEIAEMAELWTYFAKEEFLKVCVRQ